MPKYYKYDWDKYPYIFQIASGLFFSGQFQELIEEQLVNKAVEDELNQIQLTLHYSGSYYLSHLLDAGRESNFQMNLIVLDKMYFRLFIQGTT